MPILNASRPWRYKLPVLTSRRAGILAFCMTCSLAPLAQADPAQTSADASKGAPGAVPAQSAKPAGALTLANKPAWLTDFSFGIKESYDNNVFYVSGRNAPERDSWITTVSPKIGFNFAPLLGDQKILQVLALGYAPDFVTYHEVSSEDYNAHRIATTLAGKTDAFTFYGENGFNFIDGSKEAPIYAGNDSQRSAYATAAPRERRQQMQDRAKINLQYDVGSWFVRPTAYLLDYDLLTDLKTNAGYQNYASRYDVNGGADLGYRVNPNVAVTLGYRYGHQYQEQFPTAIDKTHTSSPSDYQRVLAGVEGKPFNWLTVSVQGGPDFRTYPETSATHITPVDDHHPIKYYGEAAITAQLDAKDSLTFKYKQYQWVSSTGKVPYFDSLYDLMYHRVLTKALSLDLEGRIQSSDYTSGTGTSADRDDWLYVGAASLTYAFTPNLSVNLAYTAQLGRNQQDNLEAIKVDGRNRQFDDHLVSLGATFKF